VGRYPLGVRSHALCMAGKIVAQFRKGDLIATAPIRQNITHQSASESTQKRALGPRL